MRHYAVVLTLATILTVVGASFARRLAIESDLAALLPDDYLRREGFEERLRKAGIVVGSERALDDCCGPSA